MRKAEQPTAAGSLLARAALEPTRKGSREAANESTQGCRGEPLAAALADASRHRCLSAIPTRVFPGEKASFLLFFSLQKSATSSNQTFLFLVFFSVSARSVRGLANRWYGPPLHRPPVGCPTPAGWEVPENLPGVDRTPFKR